MGNIETGMQNSETGRDPKNVPFWTSNDVEKLDNDAPLKVTKTCDPISHREPTGTVRKKLHRPVKAQATKKVYRKCGAMDKI